MAVFLKIVMSLSPVSRILVQQANVKLSQMPRAGICDVMLVTSGVDFVSVNLLR